MTETHELAVMCDTFHPLKLSKLAWTLMTGYAYSWYEEPGAVKEAATADEDPAGVRVTLLGRDDHRPAPLVRAVRSDLLQPVAEAAATRRCIARDVAEPARPTRAHARSPG